MMEILLTNFDGVNNASSLMVSEMYMRQREVVFLFLNIQKKQASIDPAGRETHNLAPEVIQNCVPNGSCS
jgi:hypothetical protein